MYLVISIIVFIIVIVIVIVMITIVIITMIISIAYLCVIPRSIKRIYSARTIIDLFI